MATAIRSEPKSFQQIQKDPECRIGVSYCYDTHNALRNRLRLEFNEVPYTNPMGDLEALLSRDPHHSVTIVYISSFFHSGEGFAYVIVGAAARSRFIYNMFRASAQWEEPCFATPVLAHGFDEVLRGERLWKLNMTTGRPNFKILDVSTKKKDGGGWEETKAKFCYQSAVKAWGTLVFSLPKAKRIEADYEREGLALDLEYSSDETIDSEDLDDYDDASKLEEEKCQSKEKADSGTETEDSTR